MNNTEIGKRARYTLPSPTSPTENKTGKLQAEICRWEVDGFHHTHEFRFIATAEVTDNFLKVQNVVEHRVGDRLVNKIEWGHDSANAYTSSQVWREIGKPGGCSTYSAELLAARIFRYDLPCCGGEFVKENEHTGLGTLVTGVCRKCGDRWEIVDGQQFIHRVARR